jgi:hypothetical protein
MRVSQKLYISIGKKMPPYLKKFLFFDDSRGLFSLSLVAEKSDITCLKPAKHSSTV